MQTSSIFRTRRTFVFLSTVFLSTMILLFSVVASSFAEAPEAVPGATTISSDRAKQLFDEGVLFVDVRSAEIYNREHIERAIHLDLQGGFTKAALSSLLEKDQPMVLYCDGISCGRSAIAADRAAKWGFSNVLYYREGFPAWKSMGYPVQ